MYIMYMCPVKSWTLGDSYFAEYRHMCRRIMYVYYVHVPVKSWTLGDSYFAKYRQMCRRIMYVYYVHVSC
jgi:hypothetical protein